MYRTGRLILLLACATALALPSVGNAQTGGISGTVSSPTGPIQGATVTIFDSGGVQADQLTTLGTGFYFSPDLTPGTYTVRFAQTGFVTEFWDNKPSQVTADVVTVTADVITPHIDATLSVEGQTGGITGTVTGASGTIASAVVRVFDSGGVQVSEASTNASGVYSFTGLAPGEYKLRFAAPGYVAEYYNDKTSLDAATKVIVNGGGTTSGIDATLTTEPPVTGGITGTVTGASGAIASALVQVFDSAGTQLNQTSTDATGGYSFVGLAAGAYKLRFAAPGFVAEYYNDKSSVETADSVTVTGGATTPGINAALAAEPPPGPTTSALPAKLLAGSTVTAAADGSVTLSLSCPAGAGCVGTIALTTSASSASFAAAVTTIGRASFNIPAGKTKKVKIRLTAKGRKLLKKKKRLKVKATVTTVTGTTKTVTKKSFTLVAKKKR